MPDDHAAQHPVDGQQQGPGTGATTRIPRAISATSTATPSTPGTRGRAARQTSPGSTGAPSTERLMTTMSTPVSTAVATTRDHRADEAGDAGAGQEPGDLRRGRGEPPSPCAEDVTTSWSTTCTTWLITATIADAPSTTRGCARM